MARALRNTTEGKMADEKKEKTQKEKEAEAWKATGHKIGRAALTLFFGGPIRICITLFLILLLLNGSGWLLVQDPGGVAGTLVGETVQRFQQTAAVDPEAQGQLLNALYVGLFIGGAILFGKLFLGWGKGNNRRGGGGGGSHPS